MQGSTNYCPGCVQRIPFKIPFSSVVICPNCICSYQKTDHKIEFLQKEEPVFEDMTPLRIEVQRQYESKTFEVTGRIQYTFEKNYRNFWALFFSDQSFCWLAEAYGDYAIFKKEELKPNTPNLANLKAGKTVEFSNKATYEIDRTDKNISIQMEGELPEHVKDTGFTCVELSTDSQEKALVHILPASRMVIYTGKIMSFDSFKFKYLR